MRIRVRWLDEAAWAVREEVIESPSREAAAASLAARGATVLGLDEAGPSPRAVALDVPWWCRELRVLLAAGMTVVEAVDTLLVQAADPPRRALHEHLSAALARGQSLSAAMAASGSFPPVLVAGVVAGERTGSLLDALDEYLRYHELIEQLQRRLVSAALYPAVVLAVGLVVVLFLLGFVVPRFSATYADLRGAIGGTTQVLLAASSLLREHSALLAWGLAAALAALAWAWQRGHARRAALLLGDALPPLRRLLDQFRLARLYHALAVMFRGGYTLPEALARCATLGLGARWERAIGRAAAALQQGRGVAAAFAEVGLSDEVSARLLGVGERSGGFAQVLQAIAERHGTRFATAVERATRLVEPLLLLLVAAAVGGVVVAMYLPVFDLASGLR